MSDPMPAPPRGASRFPTAWILPRALVALSVAAILLPTLYPSRGADAGGFGVACFWCDERAAADAVANIVLFLPLGAALALCGVSLGRAAALALLLSLSVEAAQFAIVPGRDANPADVLFNTLGGALGAVALPLLLRSLLPPPARAARLSLLASAVATALAGAGLWLLTPAPPRLDTVMEWEQHRGNLATYEGKVLRAELGGLSYLPGDRVNGTVVRRLLDGETRLEVLVIAGPPPPRLAQIASIGGGSVGELFFVGPDGEDLVVKYRTRSAQVRLDQPGIVVPGALRGVRPGDPFRVSVWRGARGLCVQAPAAAACGLGYTVGDIWEVLLYSDFFSPRLSLGLSLASLALLFLPVGLWLRRSPESAAGLLLILLATWGLPRLLSLPPTARTDFLGIALGLALGAALRARYSRRGGAATGDEPLRRSGAPQRPPGAGGADAGRPGIPTPTRAAAASAGGAANGT